MEAIKSGKKNILRIALATALILMVPLVAMQFTKEVNWTLSDFIIMGTLIFVTGLMLDLARRKAGKWRGVAIMMTLAVFFWLWVELAVGLFTNWGS